MQFQKLKSTLGTWFFCALSLYSTIRVLLERPTSGHYRIFTGAARVLWQKQDPYEYDFHSVGYWFYSQSCAMFFFSLFAYLPDLLGLLLYTLFSVGAFVAALLYFYSEFFQETIAVTFKRREVQWTLALAGLQIFEAINAAKVETVMVAVLLFSITRWMQGRFLLGALLLGMVVEWKFQPLPIVGLVLMVFLVARRQLLPLFYFGTSVVLWHFLPAVFLGWSTLQQLELHHQNSLTHFLVESYAHYDNFYKFLAAIRLPVSWGGSLILSGAIGLVFFLGVTGESFKNRLKFLEKLLLAMTLGSVFLFALSPMAQNNGSIAATGVLICAVYLATHAQQKWIKFQSITVLVFFSFAYSDLLPGFIKNGLRDFSVKSAIVLAFGFLSYFSFRADLRKNSSP